MAIRDSLFVQNSGPTGILDVEECRVALGALVMPHTSTVKAKSGFRPGPGSSPGLVTATGTPDAFVHVAPFQLLLQGGRSSVAGTYFACADAQVDINVLSVPADPTNPRNDLIIAQQSDTFYGDGSSPFAVTIVRGTPSGSPADPTITGSGDHVVLARVRVDANVTTIVSGKITDLRTSGHAKSLVGGLYSVSLGGLLPVTTKAERDALTGTYGGLPVWRTDIQAINVADGAGGWRYFARPTEARISTVEGTVSTTYVDLATSGPAVTLETGDAALVTITTGIYNSGANVSYASFAVTGASNIVATDLDSIQNAVTSGIRVSMQALVTGLTPGSNIFTMKYRAAAGTANFYERVIHVEPK
jgi:hypothetical protein